MGSGDDGENDLRGLLWKLPLVESKHLGKVGPAFGFGAGCGLGFGVGLVGGAGFGSGFPGLHIGYGFGAGCGIGLGYGYGFGRGVAHDDHRRYSNVGKLFNGPGLLPSQDELTGLIDELVINTKKVIRATSKEIDKWRR